MSKQLEILRVKRKRDQDPLQALVLENNDTFKRSKKNSYFFKFARTEVDETVDDQPILTIDESRKLSVINRKVPIEIQPTTTIDDTDKRELSEDILSMIQEQENNGLNNSSLHKHKKPIRRKHSKAEPIDSYNNSNDYVYDIYFRDIVDDESKYEQLRIAYFTYDEDIFNFVDEKLVTSDTEQLQDDEDIDSNAEDYYQNDYPEDEDQDNNDYLDIEERRHLNEILDNTEDLVMSDDEDDNFEIQHNKRRFSTKDYQTYKDGGVLDNEQEIAMTEDLTQEGFDNLYDDFYNSADDYEGPTSFLDDGRVSDEDEAEFKRNYFFKNDEDDELAIHRDKIFGKLEKMIKQKNQ